MIDLTLPCDTDDASAQPFVARLSTSEDDRVGRDLTAVLVAEDKERTFFQIHGGTFSLPKLVDDGYHGDVVFVDPRARKAQRWIRANSRHNTLLATEQCDQLCLMCSQPPKKTHVDLFAYYETACRLAPCDLTIGISGGEPTLHKEALFRLLDRMRCDRPDLGFHVLTNAQHFEEKDRAILRRLKNVYWGAPIYSADARTHDEIVGKDSAFEALSRGLSILGLSGAAIELRTVVMQTNAQGLPALAQFIVGSASFIDVWAIMQLENIGFARNAWGCLFFDHSKEFIPIANALTTATLHGVNAALYNFPLCTVPAEWRGFAVRSISDWKRKYLRPCNDCTAIERCSGFFEWHPTDHGYERLAPL